MDDELRRELIIDNYENPCNKKTINDPSYINIHAKSDSCIDDINIFVKIENDKIIDFYFDGDACCISTSLTSILIQKMIGKTVNEALDILDNYDNMINEKEYDNNKLEELMAYENISKQPARIKCATISTNALRKAINKYKGE